MLGEWVGRVVGLLAAVISFPGADKRRAWAEEGHTQLGRPDTSSVHKRPLTS